MSYFQPVKYVKDESNNPLFNPVSKKFVFRMVRYPLALIFTGVFFLSQVIWPLIVFETSDTTMKPVESTVLGLASGFQNFEFNELENTGGSVLSSNVPEYYYISIPKLKIENAKVESFPQDLNPDAALGHYSGSSYPGQPGNAFIYGHSVLPAFFNPKNYKTIFSTLHRLNVGDEFSISYNNNVYKYRVESKQDLKPEQVDPLKEFKPGYLNESTVTLMTCSPAGTKLKRLLINAVLVN